MDDLEFRRRILSEPKYRDQEINDAICFSETNSSFASDVLDLETRIEQAMQINVPENLADRILLNQDSGTVQAPVKKQLLSLAASIAFLAGILVGQINWSPLFVNQAHASLVDTAISHVEHEKPFISNLDEQVTSRQVNAKLNPFAYEFVEEFPYHIYYLNHCGFGDSMALHMVFQGTKGKVTLFITNIHSKDTIDFNKDGMEGTVMPLDNSSFILVGDEGEDIESIATRLTAIIHPAS